MSDVAVIMTFRNLVATLNVKSIFPFCKLKIGSLIPAIQIYMSKIGPRQKKCRFFPELKKSLTD